MVVDDLDIFGSRIGPAEADSVLVIDADRMLTGSITLELFQPQAGKAKGLKGHSRLQLVQRPGGSGVEVWGQSPPGSLGVLAVEDVLGAPVPERDDQTLGPFSQRSA